MKASKRKLAVLIIFLVVLALILGSCSVLNVKTQKYTATEKDGKFEIRQYEPYIIIETLVDSDFEEAGNIAFGRLLSYINGNNLSKEKIAMTAPVNQQQSGDSWAVSFVMPEKYTMQTLPKPLDQEVVLKEMPGRKMASIRYTGSWSRLIYDEKELDLRHFIQKQNLIIIGQPVWARYNPPFYPSFFRRNEILFPVE